MKAKEIQTALRALKDPERAKKSMWFFKTGKGEYGEGDKFLGIRVPVIRQHVRKFKDTPLKEALTVLKSPYHEERLFAVLLMVELYKRGDSKTRKQVFTGYLKNTRYINNWDIVDGSAHYIVGPWLEDKNKNQLKDLALSKDLWERRIAIIATYHFIRNSRYEDTLKIAKMLLDDEQDLIHKAVGWMLREVGNRDRQVEESFLEKHYDVMPRTMLRYAIEKFSPQRRQQYLKGLI